MNIKQIRERARQVRGAYFRRGPTTGWKTPILLLGLLALVVVAGITWRWQLSVPDSAREMWREVSDATITGQVKAAFALS